MDICNLVGEIKDQVLLNDRGIKGEEFVILSMYDVVINLLPYSNGIVHSNFLVCLTVHLTELFCTLHWKYNVYRRIPQIH